MYFYFAQFYPEEKGGYSVFFPDMPGCCTCGDDLKEAMVMAMDALSGYLEWEIEDGQTLPEPSDYETAKAKAIAYNNELEIPPNDASLYLLIPADTRIEERVDVSISIRPSVLALVDKHAQSEGMTRNSFFEVSSLNYINMINSL